MESIISPWFIYLLSLVDFFKEFFGFFAVVSGMAITTYLIGKVVIATRDGDDSNEMKNWGNVWKKAKVNLVIVIFWVFLVLGIFLPTRNTLIAMYVADKVTYAKVEKVVKITEDIKGQLKKDVMDIIGAIKKGTIKEEEDKK